MSEVGCRVLRFAAFVSSCKLGLAYEKYEVRKIKIRKIGQSRVVARALALHRSFDAVFGLG